MVDDANRKDQPSDGTGPRSFYVVGIGASAGGVSALRQFFSNVEPNSDLAFVVIQHLSPQHESSLPRLIQAQTTVPVTQVNEVVKIQPNHIYVIPPIKYLVMADGHIRPTAPELTRGSHTSIDLFFRTLAEAYGTNAIAILLSGSGTDGTFGLRRIKEAGGFVIAEDPAEAEYPGMPSSAIESGLVDLVLPVSQMPAKLRSLRDGAERLQVPADPEDSVQGDNEATLREILMLLRLRTGHDFSQYKRPTLIRRMARRMQVHELSHLSAYLDFLRASPEELELLFRDLLITVTNFFRDHNSFEALEHDIIPRLFEGKRSTDHVRVWSVGCATGEEAYSLAMLLAEYASQLRERPTVQVFATDLDPQAITTGRECVYPETITLDVSPQRLQRFFVKDGDRYKVKRELRETVLLAVHNVLRDPPFSRIDLICCRNLLIYLNRAMQERLLGICHFALRPNGYLFLGSSESAEVAGSLFASVDKKHRIYRCRPFSQTDQHFAAEWVAPRWHGVPDELNELSRVARPSSSHSVGELHQEIVEQIAPPSVLVNEDFEILHMSRNAGRYLRFSGGEPTRNLPKLIHPDLRTDLHAALLEAKTGDSTGAIQSRRVTLELEGRQCWVTLTVRLANRPPEVARLYLVMFDEAAALTQLALPASSDEVDRPGLKAIEHLEEELQRTREQLRLTVEQYETSTEELRASNEELQAINEELRSATEELETSKEELQSVNEELTTVNQEYREKIEEVGRANSDLQNLMASTDIGTIFLDRSLRIERYTPRAQELFNIEGGDVGRPLQHFTHKLDYDSLPADAEKVLRNLRTIEREVHSSSGSWYLVRLIPYRTVDDKIDGVVLNFIDITSRRKAEEQLREQTARLLEQAEIVNLGDLLVRDANERIILWSAGCERLYGYTHQEALGKPVHELLRTEFPQPLEEIKSILESRGQWEGELVHHDRNGNRIVVVSRWVLHRSEPGRPSVVLQVNNDITARREAEEALRQADRNKDQFLATLAHELRNPLSAMLNSVELLQRPAVNREDTERAGELLRRQIGHLLRLVDDLLDVERLAHGKITLKKNPVRLSEIIDSAQQICQPLIDSNDHDFRVSLPPEVTLNVDGERVAQVIANLLHNAFKYTPGGGRIDLMVELQDGEIILHVRDSGIGIPAEVLPHIFDMYTQGGGSSETGLKGLGVGLALVRQLVELHGGSVAAFSQGPQKGSEFVVRLPIAEPGDTQVVQRQERIPLSAGRESAADNHSVLIVDDHRDAADALAALLESSGYKVETCYEGTAALEIARNYRPDAAILDIGLPGMNGYELGRRLREMLPDVLLIALSGWQEDESRTAARQAGFDHYMVKPVQVAELQKILKAPRRVN